MKKEFVQPDVVLEKFSAEDVITASSGGVIEGYGPDTDGSYDFGQRT